MKASSRHPQIIDVILPCNLRCVPQWGQRQVRLTSPLNL
jgi:hypothetical protein